jgi:hypothetical protein
VYSVEVAGVDGLSKGDDHGLDIVKGKLLGEEGLDDEVDRIFLDLACRLAVVAAVGFDEVLLPLKASLLSEDQVVPLDLLLESVAIDLHYPQVEVVNELGILAVLGLDEHDVQFAIEEGEGPALDEGNGQREVLHEAGTVDVEGDELLDDGEERRLVLGIERDVGPQAEKVRIDVLLLDDLLVFS